MWTADLILILNIFTLLCGASKVLMKALKAFIKTWDTTKKYENKNLS